MDHVFRSTVSLPRASVETSTVDEAMQAPRAGTREYGLLHPAIDWGFEERAQAESIACQVAQVTAHLPGSEMKRHLLILAMGAAFLGSITHTSSVPAQTSAAPILRAIEFNGRTLDASGQLLLRQVEARIGPVPDGRYWYDRMSGAAGVWGGPAAAYLGPGLAFGGSLPAAASGGGDGRLTGVFVNGRELHPVDVQGLLRLGPVIPGRYWWDAAGNVGAEGGTVLFNFNALLARQRRGQGEPYYRSDPGKGESTYVGQGCAAVHGRLRSGDEGSATSYYVGCD